MTARDSVGERIRQLREGRELSIAELAKRSQVSVELIEQLESGELACSLAHLMKIARGLGVRLGTFCDDLPLGSPVIVRAGRSEKVVHFSGGSDVDKDGTLEFFSLALNKKDRHMEPFIIDVHQSSSQDYPLSSHEGEEFIYVLAGEIEVCYGKENHKLSVGDSIYYDSIVPHNVHASGDGDARILAVVYTPF